MFVLLLTYTAPLEQIDALLDEHRAYLDRHYASGVFLASGRREPRTGGVILAGGPGVDAATLRAISEEDPFTRAGAPTYDIVEFVPGRSAGADALAAALAA